MRFLLDVNISPSLGELLESLGHSTRSVSRMGLLKLADHQILALARKAGETAITHDLDFGNLMAFSGDERPSVLIFRIHRLTAELMFEKISDNWPVLQEPLENGSIVIIEEVNIRIRQLPIRKI